MSFRKVGTGLPGLVASWIDDPELRWSLLVQTWKQVVGEVVARHTEPLAIDDGVLSVRVDEGAWSHPLGAMEREIVAGLRAALGDESVRTIRWTGSADQTGSSASPSKG